MNNIPYSSVADSEQFRNCRLSESGGAQISDRDHVSSGKLATPGFFSLIACLPSFFALIPNVVRRGAKPQVSGIHTGRVIPSRAIMEHVHSGRNRATVNCPRYTMGKHPLSVKAGLTVSVRKHGSFPQPAAVRRGSFIGVSLESTYEAFSENDFTFFSHVSSSGSDLFTKAIGAAVSLKNGKRRVTYA